MGSSLSRYPSPVGPYRYVARMTSAVVVGAGVFGSALARQLARDGLDVVLVDQEPPGWAGSSSGGETRLLRFSHGSHDWYARSAWRARELWREIGTDLLTECGIAWFAHADTGWEADSERTLRSLAIPAERLEPAEAARLFPDLKVDDVEWVLFEPCAGVLRAEDGVRRLAEQAVEAGARLVRGRAEAIGGLPAVDGRVLEADHVVWACGPWLPRLFPELVSLRVTRQEVLFFEAPPEWRDAPGWVDYDGAIYGHGDLHGHGFKAASDAEGEDAEPGAPAPAAGSPPVTERAARAYLERRFPALASAPLARARPCTYELTADTHFVVARHPGHDGVWLLGGGSGHGFKHGPALAEHVAALLAGRAEPDIRFATGPRSAERSLRTAGVRATPIGRKLQP